MDALLDDIDLVGARFTQAEAVIDLIHFAVTRTDMVIGMGVLAEACMATDTLLKQGQEAFQRIESRLSKNRGK